MKKITFLILGVVLLFSCGEETRFERLDASRTGIAFNNEIIETDSFNILHNEYMYNGAGVGVADLNKDGLQDLVFTGNKVTSKIYLNLGGFEFQDITEQFKDISNKQWISGVTVVDINADGWPDLYFTSTQSKDSLLRKNQLWVHQGLDDDGLPAFEEKAEEYGIADTGHSLHSAFLDYDLDGDLDLYILNNIAGAEIPTNYRYKITDGTAINNDKFYRNLGDGTFEDVTMEAGIRYEGFGLGVACGDINKDGWPDLYISNDYISNDLLYINQQDGTFENQSKQYLSYHSKFSMGNDLSDINNDGLLDIITMDMMPEAYFRKKQTINGNGYNFYTYDAKYGYEKQYVRNMVHLHNGFVKDQMLPFSEVGQMLGVYQTEWSWSPLFADYDNDGDKDLLITNGFPKDLTDKDFTNYKAQYYGYLMGDKELLPKIPIVKVSNYAFENRGDYTFENQTVEWGMDIPSFSNGASFVDLDNDGDLDYVTNNINDIAFVYKNNTKEKFEAPSNYFKLEFRGKADNPAAIGAKVKLWAGGKLHYYEHYMNRGYISSVDPIVHFGLGDLEKVDSLRITWTGGKQSTFLENLEINTTLTIEEVKWGNITDNERPAPPKNFLFEKQDSAIDFTHVQEDFVDFFQNQRILQHKFSQIGPCMAKGDLDGDGNEDLFIGGSEDAPAAVFLNKGDVFEKTEVEGLTDQKECLESDIVIADIDQDGDQDMIALSGGVSNFNTTAYQHYFYENQNGVFQKTALPTPNFSASVVRPFDYDKDGDLDIFIGARLALGNFPSAPPSYLLDNNDGTFSEEGAIPLELGMVTDAVWSDYDGDGWTDLIVTREWNSISILKNNEGKSLAPISSDNLASKRGFWTAIAAGDLDGDGDDDYILGNLGENHRFHVDDEFPMILYGVDIDNNGAIDPITAAFWKDKEGVMQEYPVNYLDELASQSPYFRKKFTSYTRFSYSTMDTLFDKSTFAKEDIYTVNTTSSYILWNEDAGFVWERLPSEVQSAPLKKIMVRDFNSDNQLDILFAGNDYGYDVSTGYYEANKGVLLLNAGDKSFEVSLPSQSGFWVRGQVDDLEYLEGKDGADWLIAGVNRDRLLVYKITEKGL